MREDHMTDQVFDAGPGEGIRFALPDDLMRWRHISTRAINRRAVVVLAVDEAEFEGYVIGVDDYSIQLLELPSGDVSTIALGHIVSITDGKPFKELTPEEMGIVERRTASFRKTSQAWLEANWPGVYGQKKPAAASPFPHRQRVSRPPYGKPPYSVRYGQAADQEGSSYADSEVRHGAGENGDQDRGQ